MLSWDILWMSVLSLGCTDMTWPWRYKIVYMRTMKLHTLIIWGSGATKFLILSGLFMTNCQYNQAGVYILQAKIGSGEGFQVWFHANRKKTWKPSPPPMFYYKKRKKEVTNGFLNTIGVKNANKQT